MSKIYYYMTITIGLTILLKLAGIQIAGADSLINLFGLDSNNVTTSTSFFIITLGISFAIAATLGSIFSKESSVRAGFIIATGVVGIGIGTFIGILNYVRNTAQGSQEWIFYIVFMIFAVWIVGYILALIDFWGGTG